MSFFGYLSLIGIIGTGATSGIIYSSFKNQKPYIDRLFEEIKQDIENFSSKYPSAQEASKRLDVQEGLKTKEEILSKLENLWSHLLNKHLESSNIQNGEDDTSVENIVKNLLNENEFQNIYEKIKEFISLIEKPKSNNDELEENGSVINKSIYMKKIKELLSVSKVSSNKYEDIE